MSRRFGSGAGGAAKAVVAAPSLFGRWLMDSYRNLPEWSQPIVWGLLAASPLLGGFAVYLIWYR